MNIVDMTWKYTYDMLVYQGGTPPKFRKEGNTDQGDALEMTFVDDFCLHFGTHVDCPAHMVKGGAHVEDFDLEYFIGKGVVIDCSKYKLGQKYGIEVLDGYDLSDKDFVFFYINWAQYWDKKEQYGDYPVMTNDLADYLGQLEHLRGIAVETNGIDKVGDDSLVIHKTYLKYKDKLIYEAVTNMDKLIGKDFTFYGMPLLVEKAEGGITKAFAMVN